MYQPRTYRRWVQSQELVLFNVIHKETDLYIGASKNLTQETIRLLLELRTGLDNYIINHDDFLSSLKPLKVSDNAPDIVKEMAWAAAKAGVGPMAAVAGAIAEYIGRGLSDFSQEVIVENGGDIYLKSLRQRKVAIYAGDSPLSGNITLLIKAEDMPLGVCTSSGTVGHSLSFGRADAAVVVSKSASLADAVATATGNRVSKVGDIQKGLDYACSIPGVLGAIIIKGDKIGIRGDIEIA